MTRPRLFGLAFALLLASTPARADYKDDYKDALEAIDKKKWPDAVRLLRSALAGQSQEGERVKLYGMRYETYLPHYHLGYALYQTGDCSGALAAWQSSESQSAIRKASQYKQLQKYKDACETRMAESKPTAKPTEATKEATKEPTREPTRVAEVRPTGPDPAVVQARQAAEAEIARATQAADRVVLLSRDPGLASIWSGDSALGGRQRQAQEQLSNARARLAAGTQQQDARTLAEAKEQASRAIQQFDSVSQEGLARKQRLAQQTPPPAKTPDGPQAAAAPVELMQAARAYFAGDYRRAADTLDDVDYPSGPAAAQARLFRAAARFALFVTGGQQDEDLRKSAVSDVLACRRLDASLRPDPQAFSPRFVAFFSKAQ